MCSSLITHTCSNDYQDIYEGEKIIFSLDENGDFYIGKNYEKSLLLFPDENYEAIGSYSKKTSIEIYKKGVKDKIYLHPILFLFLFKPYIEFHYEADIEGNVLKKWWTIGILKKDDEGDYFLGAEFCWRTWSYLWRKFKRNIKNKPEKAFKPSLNRAWVYKWFENFVKIMYWKKYKKIK